MPLPSVPPSIPTAAANRIWELDALRGLCVLLMFIDHTLYDLGFIFGDIWRQAGISGTLIDLCLFARDAFWPSLFRKIIRVGVLASFIGLCGLSCSFSRSNLWRGLKLLVIALLLSLVTWIMDRCLGQRDVFTIRCGVLHMLAISILLYNLVQPFSRNIVLVMGLLLAALGLYFHGNPLPASGLVAGVLGISSTGFYSADYFPLLPWSGYFLVGAACGVSLYHTRVSYFPRHGQNKAWRPLLFLGRNALLFYLLHQPIVYGTLWLFTKIILH
ncbi:MAG: heparan-alpha-glucosaminide N-acetyltransferase domain-containing protein [Clostridiales bacterium]